MKRYYSDVREAMREVFKNDWEGKRGIKSRGADRVSVTVGYEGSGKSNLALWGIEMWYETIGVKRDMIKQICGKPEEFAQCLLQSQPYDRIMADEGVLMSYARKGMSESNVQVNKMLMVCRGKHYYFDILIPQLLDLDSYIRKNRVSSVWVMLPGYKVAYFSRRRVHSLLGKMAFMSRSGTHADPMKLGVRPNFIARVPLYSGPLADAYSEIKERNMNAVIKSLSDELLKQEKVKAAKPKKIDYLEKRLIIGLSQNRLRKDVAHDLGITAPALTSRVQKLKSMGIDPYQSYSESELNSWMN